MTRILPLLVLLTGSVAWAAPPKVLLLPFESLAAPEKTWVARAIQQNLLAELSRVNSIQPIVAQPATSDPATALQAAQASGAQYVIFGSYQIVETDLRIIGQVLDVSTKQSLTGLKATGSQRDLFGLEDAIAQQAKKALPQPIAAAQPEMLKQAEANPAQPAQAAPQPVRVVPFDAALRARALEAEVDRAIERMRQAADDAEAAARDAWRYRPLNYRIGPYVGYPYSGIGYPGYGYGYTTQNNVAIIGGYRGRNWNVGFQVGCGTSSSAGNLGNHVIHRPTVVRHPWMVSTQR